MIGRTGCAAASVLMALAPFLVYYDYRRRERVLSEGADDVILSQAFRSIRWKLSASLFPFRHGQLKFLKRGLPYTQAELGLLEGLVKGRRAQAYPPLVFGLLLGAFASLQGDQDQSILARTAIFVLLWFVFGLISMSELGFARLALAAIDVAKQRLALTEPLLDPQQAASEVREQASQLLSFAGLDNEFRKATLRGGGIFALQLGLIALGIIGVLVLGLTRGWGASRPVDRQIGVIVWFIAATGPAMAAWFRASLVKANLKSIAKGRLTSEQTLALDPLGVLKSNTMMIWLMCGMPAIAGWMILATTLIDRSPGMLLQAGLMEVMAVLSALVLAPRPETWKGWLRELEEGLRGSSRT